MKIGLIPLVLLLAGCVQTTRLADLPTGSCLVSDPLRMRYAGAEFKLDMRDELQWGANARVARVIRSDDVVTSDFSPNRLNIVLGDSDQIDGLSCG